ncbi:MAG: hypothetical protein ACOZIN_08750 [Myxococcota bacterium]
MSGEQTVTTIPAMGALVYPIHFRLSQVTQGVIAALERRRPAFAEWSAEAESQLEAAARATLQEMGRQFSEVADDAPYWNRVGESVMAIAVPRYLRLAKEQYLVEKNRYGLWRGGDLIGRAAYAGAGLLLATVIWRLGVPKWLELFPLLLVMFGPMVPDAQVWFARRQYAGKLHHLVEEMNAEQVHFDAYRPLSSVAEASVPSAPVNPSKEKV